jgi:hypothetical protein
MDDLRSLLQRIRLALDREADHKRQIILIIEKLSKVKIPPKDLNYKNGVLEVVASPAEKSEIKLNEGEIISKLKLEHKIIISRIFYR